MNIASDIGCVLGTNVPTKTSKRFSGQFSKLPGVHWRISIFWERNPPAHILVTSPGESKNCPWLREEIRLQRSILGGCATCDSSVTTQQHTHTQYVYTAQAVYTSKPKTIS